MALSLKRLKQNMPLFLGSSYLALLFVLLRQSDRPEVSSVTGLFLVTLLYCWWDTGQLTNNPKSEIGAIATAIGINLWLILKAWGYGEDEAFLRLLPFLSLTNWGLLCYGWQSFRIFRSGFFLLGFLAFPWEIIYVIVDLSLLTAKFTHLILFSVGLQAERIGTLIRLGTGTIEVYHGCSGLKMILQLVGFSLIYLVLNPFHWRKTSIFLGGAIAIGFLLNGMRVAMMAVLVSLGDEAAFDYWHLGTGSLIFSVIGLGALALWGWQVQQWQNV